MNKPLIINDGIVLNNETLTQYDEGTFTATLTGCTTSPTATVTYVRVGKLVSLRFPSTYLLGTSNTTQMEITGLPASLWPADEIVNFVRIQDNSTSIIGMVIIFSSGTVRFYTSVTLGGFTSSGTKGIMQSTITYCL